LSQQGAVGTRQRIGNECSERREIHLNLQQDSNIAVSHPDTMDVKSGEWLKRPDVLPSNTEIQQAFSILDNCFSEISCSGSRPENQSFKSPSLDDIPAFKGRIKTVQDALVLYEAAIRGTIHSFEPKQGHFYREKVSSGDVFIRHWNKKEHHTWYDLLSWGKASIGNGITVYSEVEKEGFKIPKENGLTKILATVEIEDRKWQLIAYSTRSNQENLTTPTQDPKFQGINPCKPLKEFVKLHWKTDRRIGKSIILFHFLFVHWLTRRYWTDKTGKSVTACNYFEDIIAFVDELDQLAMAVPNDKLQPESERSQERLGATRSPSWASGKPTVVIPPSKNLKIKQYRQLLKRARIAVSSVEDPWDSGTMSLLNTANNCLTSVIQMQNEILRDLQDLWEECQERPDVVRKVGDTSGAAAGGDTSGAAAGGPSKDEEHIPDTTTSSVVTETSGSKREGTHDPRLGQSYDDTNLLLLLLMKAS